MGQALLANAGRSHMAAFAKATAANVRTLSPPKPWRRRGICRAASGETEGAYHPFLILGGSSSPKFQPLPIGGSIQS
jgi:hypothetical protein